MMQFVVGMALVAALACWAPSAHAALPGANGKILVQSNMTGHFDIYSINPDGSGMKNLTNGSVDSVNAKASPDGKHIIFFSDRDADNVMELWIMNADGSHQRLLYQPPLGVPGETGPYNGGFASNNVIVFDSDHNVSGGYPPGEEIYTINIDGTGLKRLTYNNFFDGDPSIRPDGKQIVFTSDRDTNSTTNEVYTMTATGSNVTRLTHNAPAQDFGPSYSPDGKKIVWYTNVAGHFDIFTMNDNGSGKMNLTHSSGPDNTNPTFSPDGTKVAFSSNRDTGSSQTSEIYTMNVHGSNVTRLTLGGTSTNVPTDWLPIPLPPTVSRFRVAKRAFSVSGTTMRKTGTTFIYTLSEAATVKIVISDRLRGRSHRDGTLAQIGHPGVNKLAFSGRFGSRALAPGLYQAALTATEAKLTSKPKEVSFRVLGP